MCRQILTVVSGEQTGPISPATTKKQPYPDDAAMLDALVEMAGAEDIFHRILVKNPAELFGFGN